MNDDDRVSAREFIEEIVKRESRFTDHRFAIERALRIEFVAAVFAFGMFAWTQIQRRLEILNHENARVAQIAAETVSADTYKSDENRRDDDRVKLDAWRAGVDEKFTKSLTREEFARESKYERRQGVDTSTKVLGVAFAVVALAVSILVYRSSNPAPTVVPGTTVTVTTSTP